MSRQERQRIPEAEDAEPYLPGFTWGEFNRLPERQQQRETQKAFQEFTSSLGYFKTCGLASCRRARACKGFLSEEQYRSGRYHTSFPPCIGENGRLQSQVLAEAWRLAGYPDGRNPEAG
ncbi:hypothetical protein OIU34_11865 [Pararhizobium sp. BT-229]|uniref:hypothetical protein n=1 Tax=Pararhizobium sp. BT-229 TaxID=2986923 RepID=UPI0021F7A210|nr:hypothetical protein [Pararhizobium sp. BT-229]MCV9962595.1 hypothetical protein [Pararhizobium sp. BT-229]